MARPIDDDFADFVRSRQRSLLHAAYLVCGDRHQAEDVVQEAFAKLASRWESVRLRSPDAYVRRIVHHDAVSNWRRWGKRQRVVDHTAAASPFATRPAPDQIGGWVDGAEVRQALAQLSPQQRAVMVLRYYDDLSEAEIAETLSIAPGTVKGYAKAALDRLRTLLPGLAPALVAEGEGS